MDTSQLPALNAVLNGLSALFLTAGFLAIRARRIPVHRALMLSAFVTSTLFLISYVTYHLSQVHQVFSGPEALRVPYYVMLTSHVLLAIALVPLALITLTRAWRGDFARHRRIARWTLPIWLYVSVTGVLVYLILYVIFPAA
jgi:putative membrane protein